MCGRQKPESLAACVAGMTPAHLGLVLQLLGQHLRLLLRWLAQESIARQGFELHSGIDFRPLREKARFGYMAF